MAELAKKFHLKKGTTEHVAKAYSTTAEAGTHWCNAKIDGIAAYIPIGASTDSRATSGMVMGSGGDTYAILNSGKPPYNKVEYWTPGTYTFTVPAGVTTARVTVAGAGGGGGAGAVTVKGVPFTGGTGGTGALTTQSRSVTPFSTLSVVVGAGGSGGYFTPNERRGKAGGAGGTSAILGITAQGGGGGEAAWVEINGTNGTNGMSYGNGGSGGSGGRGCSGSNGSPGWVIIEYGGNI